MKSQVEEESELRWTDVLLMLVIVSVLVFTLALQSSAQPEVVLDAFSGTVDGLLDGLQFMLAPVLLLLLELLEMLG